MADVLSLKEVPSLRCAREAAEVSAGGFADWVPQHTKVRVNALLDGDPSIMAARAQSAVDAGCRCFKVKVAGMSLNSLRCVLDDLCAVAGPVFRLDPNRSWGFDEAIEVASALKGYPVEYIEEPLRDSSLLPSFIADSPIPVALDETLREIEPGVLIRYAGAVALILKPTLMGGFRRARAFADAGHQQGMAAVVSACFESGVGIHALGRFAASLSTCPAAGLDTYSRLATDVLNPRLNLGGFVLDPSLPLPEINPDVVAL